MDNARQERHEIVLDSFPFLANEPRWGGFVEIVRVTYEKPEYKTFIDFRLRIGSRYVSLSRRGIPEVIEALSKGVEAASRHYAGLLTELNAPEKNSPPQSPRGSPR